jgi:hypothetical protein
MQGLFSNQTPSFFTFWKPFEWKILTSFITTLWPFALFYGNLVHVVAISYTHYPHYGTLYQEKSGNPGCMYINIFNATSNLNCFVHYHLGQNFGKNRGC